MRTFILCIFARTPGMALVGEREGCLVLESSCVLQETETSALNLQGVVI